MDPSNPKSKIATTGIMYEQYNKYTQILTTVLFNHNSKRVNMCRGLNST